MSEPHALSRIIALLHGPDQKGLVARTAGWIFERGGNIIHADQHRDNEAGVFFQRIEWEPETRNLELDAIAFRHFAESLGMRVQLSLSTDLPRMAVFVSKFEHCFHDLMLRWKSGELRCVIPLIVSNHPDLAEAAAGYGVPYVCLSLSEASKEVIESRQLELMREYKIDLIVMARYMQILSPKFLETCQSSVINIHHSFLPAFAGAKPYHQAYKRGVKLIGATAHYATQDLDEGPIIQQEVAHVNHRDSVDDLIRKGRDLEKRVLAQAVRWHLERRVLAYANRTVVFD
jgi:formyltetrahydrofolate deformylase